MTKKTTAHKKKTTHTTHHTPKKHHETTPAPSDDTFVWKVGFFVVLGLAVILIFFLLSGGTANIGQIGAGEQRAPGAFAGDGVVVIEEFSDFTCPFCQQVQPTVRQLKDMYADNIEVRYNHFARGPASYPPSEAAECARDQGAFNEYKQTLYANQGQFAQAQLIQYAVQLGLNEQQFRSCVESGEKRSIVDEHTQRGRSQGVSGTPTFFVGGEQVVGAQPINAFQQVIDRKLSEGGTQAVPQGTPGAEFELIVIDDPQCSVCSTQDVVAALQTQYFTGAQLRTLSVNDAEAQQLITQHDIQAIPAFLLASGAQEDANFAQIAQALELRGDYYIVDPVATGTVVYTQPPAVDDAVVLGQPNAPVTIIEFTDYHCPFCKRHNDETKPLLMQQYIDNGQVRYVVMDYLRVEPKAGEARHCVNEQLGAEGLWNMHNLLFDNQGNLEITNLKQIARQINGIDADAFDECLDSGRYLSNVERDTEIAQQFGIGGTPGFLVNGIRLSGALPFEAFQEVIDSQLN